MKKIVHYSNAEYRKPSKKELYEHYIHGGVTMKWLEGHYGVSDHIIKRWLKGYGIRKYQQYKLLDEMAIYTLKESGFSFEEIAKVLDRKADTMLRLYNKHKAWLEQDNAE